MSKVDRNELGGIFRKGDVIIVKRTDVPGGGAFNVELDSFSGLAGQNQSDEQVTVRALSGNRVDTLTFTSANKLHKNGRTKVIQTLDSLSPNWKDSEPMPVVVKKIKSGTG